LPEGRPIDGTKAHFQPDFRKAGFPRWTGLQGAGNWSTLPILIHSGTSQTAFRRRLVARRNSRHIMTSKYDKKATLLVADRQETEK